MYSDRGKSQINDIPLFHTAWFSGRYSVTVTGSASLQSGSILTVQVLYIPASITIIHNCVLYMA